MLAVIDRIEQRASRATSWLRCELVATRVPMLAALSIMLLGYAYAATQFQLAGDDWFAVYPENGLDEEFTLANGRWVAYLLNHDASVPGFTIPLTGVLWLAAGWLAARTWGWGRGVPLFAVATLWAVNPVLSEPLVFKLAHLVLAGFAMVAVGAGTLIVRSTRMIDRTLIAASGLLWLTLATYQPLATLTVVVWAGFEVATALRGEGPNWSALLRRTGRFVIAAIGAIAVYAVSVRISWELTGTDTLSGTTYDLGGGYVGPKTLFPHLWDLIEISWRFWTRGSPFYVVAAKLVVPIAIAGVLTVMLRSRRRGAALIVAGAGLVTLFAPFLTSLLRDEITLRYNVLMAAAAATALWAGAVVSLASRSRWPATGSAAAGGTVLALSLVLAFGMTSAFTTFKLGFERDLAIANRMLERVDQVAPPDLSTIGVYAGGRLSYSSAAPFRDPTGKGVGSTIVNCRLFQCQQFRLADAFRLLDGTNRSFVAAGPPDGAAASVYSELAVWPAPGSVTVVDGTVLIKLSE